MSSIVSNVVYGGIDGTVTTFAVMAGALGSGLTGFIVIILGMANVFADGFSMGVSSYESVVDESEDPFMKAIITFLAFITIGMIPVLGFYMVIDLDYDTKFITTIISSLLTLFMIGLFKGLASQNDSIVKSGLKTMMLGGIAGTIAYLVAISLSNLESKNKIINLESKNM